MRGSWVLGAKLGFGSRDGCKYCFFPPDFSERGGGGLALEAYRSIRMASNSLSEMSQDEIEGTCHLISCPSFEK